MAVSAVIRSHLTVTETVETGTPFATDAKAKVVHDQLNTSLSLSATTTPPITKVSTQQITISGGGGTIDLTSLPGTNGATVVGTGLKVQAIKFACPGGTDGNTDPVVIEPGASNPYSLGGSTWAGDELEPGDEITRTYRDTLADVASGAKTIDYSGTNGDVLNVMILLG